MLVDKLKRGFPLKPPDSAESGFLYTRSGLDMVVFDIIYKTGKGENQGKTLKDKKILFIVHLITERKK